jgi:hypothetical protein
MEANKLGKNEKSADYYMREIAEKDVTISQLRDDLN